MNKFIHAVLILLFAVTNAQAETGLLRARVQTSGGAALINARVVFIGPDARPLDQIRTGPTGEFSVHLPLGEYQLEINAGAFGALTRIIRIVPGTTFLPLTVEAYPGRFSKRHSALESADNLSALVLDEDLLRSGFADDQRELAVALSGRSAAGFAAALNLPQALAGTAGRDFSPQLQGPRALLAGGTDFIVNGESGRLPAKDQIRQVWLDSDPFSAEYSKPGFARVELITPVEREAFHAAATFNFRDESLNASRLVSAAGDNPRAAYQSRYLHGVLNGPLIQRKLFTSFAIERHAEDRGATLVQALTPTGMLSERLATGQADQIVNNRLHYQISPRHAFNLNARYQTLRIPSLGVGGIVLPERGFDQTVRSWDVQMRQTSLLTAAFANEVRLQALHDTTMSRPVRQGIGIDVLNAFAGGGSSGESDTRTTRYQLENLLSWSGPNVKLRLGAQGRFVRDYAFAANNTLGTFTFASLADYVAAKPSRFVQFTGEDRGTVNQTELASFAQTDWNLSSRFSLSAGVRYEAQTYLRDFNNVDPRVGFAFGLTPSFVLRGGAGIFHDRLPVAQIALFHQQDGIGGQNTVFRSEPSYPDPFVGGAILDVPSQPFLALGTQDLVAPYLMNGSLTVEKWFSSGLIVSATADMIRGVSELRANWNGELRTVDYRSEGTTSARNLTLRFRTPDVFTGRFTLKFLGDYTFGRSKDDFVPFAAKTDRQWGRTALYPSHHVWTGGTIGFPGHVGAAMWFHAHSGLPYTATTADSTQPLRSRGTVESPAYGNLDASVSKTFRIPLEMSTSGTTLTLFVYGQNVLNSRNFSLVDTNMASSLYGQPVGSGFARQLELGIRLRF
jgi:hypothetical protein